MTRLFKVRGDKPVFAARKPEANRPSLGWAERILDWIQKLALPVLGALVLYYGHELNDSMTASKLLVQREESDTKIRAEMFKAISDQLFKEPEKRTLPPEKMGMFTQMLALNFHQHIELKPLMLQADASLRNTRDPEGYFNRERDALQSVARRVRARQVAMLLGTPTGSTWTRVVSRFSSVQDMDILNRGKLEYIGVRFGGKRISPIRPDESKIEMLKMGPCDMAWDEGKNICVKDLATVTSPDKKMRVGLTVLKESDIVQERFVVRVAAQSKTGTQKGYYKYASESGSNVDVLAPEDCGIDLGRGDPVAPAVEDLGSYQQEFELTWYDFPVTDNTLLSDGNRFATYLAAWCPRNNGSPDTMKIGVLWFPKNYVPAFERQVNYETLRQRTGTQVEQ